MVGWWICRSLGWSPTVHLMEIERHCKLQDLLTLPWWAKTCSNHNIWVRGDHWSQDHLGRIPWWRHFVDLSQHTFCSIGDSDLSLRHLRTTWFDETSHQPTDFSKTFQELGNLRWSKKNLKKPGYSMVFPSHLQTTKLGMVQSRESHVLPWSMSWLDTSVMSPNWAHQNSAKVSFIVWNIPIIWRSIILKQPHFIGDRTPFNSPGKFVSTHASKLQHTIAGEGSDIAYDGWKHHLRGATVACWGMNHKHVMCWKYHDLSEMSWKNNGFESDVLSYK